MSNVLSTDWPGEWGNPFSSDLCSEQDPIGRFFLWVDRQPWYREALARELPGSTPRPLTEEGRQTAQIYRAILNLCEGSDALRPVLVFGSNQAGRHGKGAAAYAKQHYDAVYGTGEGLQGSAYGIPTKDRALGMLGLDEVKAAAERFVAHAAANRQRSYLLTRVGCGLAGYQDEQIAPLFEGCTPNVHLPGRWMERFGMGDGRPRVLVAGSRSIRDEEKVYQALDERFADQRVEPVIVAGGAAGPDTFAERYALTRGLEVERFPLWRRTEGSRATHARAIRLLWRASRAVIFWDGSSRKTGQFIKMAEEDGLPVEVIPCPPG